MTWIRHWAAPTKILFSTVLQDFAERNGAHWLIDAIASHLSHSDELKACRAKDEAFDYLHFWHLVPNDDGGATLTAVKDQDLPPVVTQEIEFTDLDFSLHGGKVTIYAGTDGPGTPTKLFLPEEY